MKKIVISIIIVLLNYNLFGGELLQKKKLKNIIYTYIMEQNYELARISVKQYIQAFPEDCEGYRLFGFIYEKENRIEQAISIYGRFAKLNKCIKLNFYAGKLAFLYGRYKLALFYLSKLIKNDKIEDSINKFVFYKLFGESYFFIGDYVSSVYYLKKSLLYNKIDIEVYDFISNAYENDGQMNYAYAYRKIRDLLIETKNKNKKLKDYIFNFQVALIFLENKKYSDAIQYLKKVELEYNNNYRYNFDFGLAYLLNNDYDNAIKYISKAIDIYLDKFSFKKIVLNILKLNRQIAKYYIVLSVAYLLNNNKKDALITYEKVKKYSPGIYKMYNFEVIENRHSKLYKDLPDMWEYNK